MGSPCRGPTLYFLLDPRQTCSGSLEEIRCLSILGTIFGHGFCHTEPEPFENEATGLL